MVLWPHLGHRVISTACRNCGFYTPTPTGVSLKILRAESYKAPFISGEQQKMALCHIPGAILGSASFLHRTHSLNNFVGGGVR